jgi:hypothetical protein
MAAQRFLALVSGKMKQIVASVIGTVDAIPAGGADGRLDVSWMPVGIAPEVTVCDATENLSAGDFVNLFLSGGVIKCRKADATTNGKPAHGFVLGSVTSGTSATVYRISNTNTSLTGLTIGADYYLHTTAGGVTATPPSAAGNVVQYLGRASSATELVFENTMTVEVA